MKKINYLGYVTAILLIGSAFWYSGLTLLGEIKPTIATFIIASVYFCISEITYWSKHKNASVWDNIAMHAGFVNVIIATLAVIFRNISTGQFVSDFSPFHLGCIGMSTVVLLFWKLTNKHSLSFLLMQLVAVIAYLPMIGRVLTSDTQTESNVMWVAILFASMTAVPSAWNAFKKKKDWLGLVYIGRVIPSNLLLVYLIFAKDYGLYPFI